MKDMQNITKKISTLLLAALVLLGTACSDIEDLQPATSISVDTAFETENAVISSLNASLRPAAMAAEF